MAFLGRCVSWLGFSYLVVTILAALYLLIQLNLSAGQTVFYILLVAVLSGLPYLFFALLNRLLTGAYAWVPWRPRVAKSLTPE